MSQSLCTVDVNSRQWLQAWLFYVIIIIIIIIISISISSIVVVVVVDVFVVFVVRRFIPVGTSFVTLNIF
jgi:hypothetical protein